MAKIKVTQVRSIIGSLSQHKLTVKALGLKKIGSSVVQEETPVIRGMVNAVRHLVKVENVVGE